MGNASSAKMGLNIGMTVFSGLLAAAGPEGMAAGALVSGANSYMEQAWDTSDSGDPHSSTPPGPPPATAAEIVEAVKVIITTLEADIKQALDQAFLTEDCNALTAKVQAQVDWFFNNYKDSFASRFTDPDPDVKKRNLQDAYDALRFHVVLERSLWEATRKLEQRQTALTETFAIRAVAYNLFLLMEAEFTAVDKALNGSKANSVESFRDDIKTVLSIYDTRFGAVYQHWTAMNQSDDYKNRDGFFAPLQLDINYNLWQELGSQIGTVPDKPQYSTVQYKTNINFTYTGEQKDRPIDFRGADTDYWALAWLELPADGDGHLHPTRQGYICSSVYATTSISKGADGSIKFDWPSNASSPRRPTGEVSALPASKEHLAVDHMAGYAYLWRFQLSNNIILDEAPIIKEDDESPEAKKVAEAEKGCSYFFIVMDAKEYFDINDDTGARFTVLLRENANLFLCHDGDDDDSTLRRRARAMRNRKLFFDSGKHKFLDDQVGIGGVVPFASYENWQALYKQMTAPPG